MTKSVSHFNGETDLTSTLSSHTWQTGETAGQRNLHIMQSFVVSMPEKLVM